MFLFKIILQITIRFIIKLCFFTKIVITNCNEKLRKLSLKFFSRIQIMKDVCEKPRNKPFLNYQGCNISNIQSVIGNHDSLRVKKTKFVTDVHKLKTNLACASEINVKIRRKNVFFISTKWRLVSSPPDETFIGWN